MMAIRVGVNGFGRIGRGCLRSIASRYQESISVVAINNTADAQSNAHFLKHDSTYGGFRGTVEVVDEHLLINGRRVDVFSQRDAARVPWSDVGVQVVIECTGAYTDAARANAHLLGGANKVVIAAPARNEDLTIVYGVNEHLYDPARHNIVSSGSCTTNCAATTLRVLLDSFSLDRCLLTTVHPYTNFQRLLDGVYGDLRRARTAPLNIIPTFSGASEGIALVLPELEGRFEGLALRIPTATVAVADFTVTFAQPVTTDAINDAFRQASCKLSDTLDITDDPVVSADLLGNPHSAIIDSQSTTVLDGSLVKVLAWYDNEWGFACRVADLVNHIGQRQ